MLGTLAATLASCEVEQKEPIYGPDGSILQNPGRVHVQQTAEDNSPAGQSFTIVDQKGAAITTIANNQWVDLEAGSYHLVGYTNAEYFDLAGTVITLKPTTRAQMPALPDGISGGAKAFNVVEDQTEEANTPFKPLTRKLKVLGELNGINPDNITSMQATLGGLASSINLTKGFGAVVTSAGGYTLPINISIVDGKLVMEVNLLGVDLDLDQLFTLTLTTADGKTYTVTINLKQALGNFNNSYSNVTFTINISLSVENESSLSGTIIDWEDGEEVEIPGV